MKFRRLTMLVALLGWVSLVHAAETTYTSASAFNAATTGITTLTFQGLATNNDAVLYNSPPGITTGGINFQSTSNNLYAIDPSHGPSFNFPSGQYLNDNSYTNTSTLNVTLLPANTTAFGADFGLQTATGATQFTLQLTLSNSDVLSIVLPAGAPTLSFFGFTSTVPITSVGLQVTSVSPTGFGQNGSLVVDNLRFGQAVVPEPSTWMLLGAGIPLVALLRRRAR